MTGSSQSHSTHKAPAPVGAYPHARQAGNFLFISGMGPRKRDYSGIPGVTFDENGNVKDYDIKEQCRSVFENIGYILEDSGSSWENLVDVTVFLTNIEEDFQAFNEVWKEHFPNGPPARTTVEVNALPTPIAIELKCVALINQ